MEVSGQCHAPADLSPEKEPQLRTGYELGDPQSRSGRKSLASAGNQTPTGYGLNGLGIVIRFPDSLLKALNYIL
jgi:hypothetical protein